MMTARTTLIIEKMRITAEVITVELHYLHESGLLQKDGCYIQLMRHI